MPAGYRAVAGLLYRRVTARWAVAALLLGAGGHAGAVEGDLPAALATERARPPAQRIERDAFLARTTLGDLQLSPDGRRIAWLQRRRNGSTVWLQPTSGGTAQALLSETPADRLYWSRDSRWLLLQASDRLFALAAAGQSGSRLLTALAAQRQELLGIDSGHRAAVLVIERPLDAAVDEDRWRLARVTVDGQRQTLYSDSRQIVDAAVDADGRLAFVTVVDQRAHLLLGRDTAGHWRPALHCAVTQRCSMLAMAGGDLLLETDIGSDLTGLARLGADGRLQMLHVDPAGVADLDHVVLDRGTGRPLIAAYRSARGAQIGLTDDARRHLDTIEAALPGGLLDIDVGTGPGARWLVGERDDTLPGTRHHLYDPAAGSLQEILSDLPFERGGEPAERLPQTAMARRLPVTWPASDGMQLHGFLSVPPGVDIAGAPLVVSVHGGPFSHDRPGFSREAQLLANRGYLVFQPNFRGSTGHGRAYLRAADGDFGNGRVQRDIVDGVRWLLASGIGDPGRVGIIGASFGGYSALLGVTFEPELFQLAVAAVPATDFGWVTRDYARSDAQMQAGIPIAVSMRALSLDPDDRAVAERLRADSPIANVQRVERPVVLLAAGRDRRVAIRSVTHYAAALAAHGRDVSLFTDPSAGHHVTDPLTAEAWLFLLEHVLHRRLGGDAPTPPDAELREHLHRHLKLRGSDLADLH